MEQQKTNIWMPYHEYVQHKKLMSEMTEEAIKKMRYFFWNNFSDKGYEDWKNKQEDYNYPTEEDLHIGWEGELFSSLHNQWESFVIKDTIDLIIALDSVKAKLIRNGK